MIRGIKLTLCFLALCFFSLQAQVSYYPPHDPLKRGSTKAVEKPIKYEPETVKWIEGIKANGGTISLHSIWAGDQHVKDLKRQGIRSDVQVVWPCLGNNLAAKLVPLINDLPYGNFSNGTTAFAEGDITETGGAVGNGLKWIETHIPMNAFGSASNYGVWVYMQANYNNNTVTREESFFGANNSGNTDKLKGRIAWSGSVIYLTVGMGGTYDVASGSVVGGKGHYYYKRASTTDMDVYVDNVQKLVGSTSTAAISSTNTIWFMAQNNNGSRTAGCSQDVSYISFGFSMDSTNRAKMKTCVDNLNARMGR